MDLDEIPRNLCELLINAIRNKFDYEFNSDAYKVSIYVIKI